MNILRQIRAGLRALLNRGESDREIADEVGHYMEEAKAQLIAAGASREEAERTVRLRYGDPSAVREDVRAYGWENGVETLLGDLRYGARRLRLSPGFTVVAVLTLGLGVGSATAIVSAVSPVLFQPLAYPHPERLVEVYDRSQTGQPVLVTFGT